MTALRASQLLSIALSCSHIASAFADDRTFVCALETAPPSGNVIIAQPQVSVDSEKATNANMPVHWVGDHVMSLGQTFTAPTSFTLKGLTFKVGKVGELFMADSSYAISLYAFSDNNSISPDSVLWTAEGKLPPEILDAWTSDPENCYLTFDLPETKLKEGKTYGLVVYAKDDAGQNNWKQNIAFECAWGSRYKGGRQIFVYSSKPGDTKDKEWLSPENDMAFWIQEK